MNNSQTIVFILGLLAIPCAFATDYGLMQDNASACNHWTKGAPFNGCKYYLVASPDDKGNCPSPTSIPTISFTCGVPKGNCYSGTQNKLNLSSPGGHVTLNPDFSQAPASVNYPECSVAISTVSFSPEQPMYSHGGKPCTLEIFSVNGWGPFPPPDNAGKLTGPFTCTLT